MLLMEPPAPPPTQAERRCVACGTPLRRYHQERREQFARRQTCSEVCELLFNGLFEGASDPRWLFMFPGARHRTWEDVPQLCSCGGPWVRVEIGVRCQLCAEERVVAVALVHLLLLEFRGVFPRSLPASTDT